MKRTLLVLALGITVQTNAQVSVGDSIKAHYMKTYQQAIDYNDAGVAINSLQNIIVETTGPNKILFKDTLSMLYFASKSYYSALILSKEVYQASPSNINALARAAECYQNLGEIKSAITDYETVAPLLKNPYYYYQLAACQYNMKRMIECQANLNKVLADTNSNKIGATFLLPNGSEQQVPVSAAALNIAAVMKIDEKNYADAKVLLENALKIYPDFEGAKQNLSYCNENMKGTKPKSAATTKPKGKG